MRLPAVIPLLVASLALASASDVRATAPSDQYEIFMPKDQNILDKKTLLRWRRADAGLQASQQAAFDHCAALVVAQTPGPWRLPTYKELLTLVDDFPHLEYENGGIVSKAIDGDAFPGTPAARFWSSSRPAQPSTDGYFVDFGSGKSGRAPSGSEYYVRCVQNKIP